MAPLKPVHYGPHAQRTRRAWDISPAEVLSALSAPDRLAGGASQRQAFKRIGARHLRVTYMEEPARLVVVAVAKKQTPWGP